MCNKKEKITVKEKQICIFCKIFFITKIRKTRSYLFHTYPEIYFSFFLGDTEQRSLGDTETKKKYF